MPVRRQSIRGRGQQEIYVVMRGRARFVIHGAEVDAPAGTLLRVDPHANREAVAIDAGTAVLVFGGESTFEPSASEWIERARPHIRANPSRAREIIADLERTLPGDRAIDVGEALLAIGQDDEPTARAIVAQLINDVPQVREVLGRDPDFGSLLPD
jgi:hypothetical protein